MTTVVRAPVPFRVMAVICLSSAAFALAFALLPTTDDGLRRLDFAVAVILVLLGILVATVLPRFAGPWALDACIAGIALIACIGAAVVQDPEGQVLVGMGLVLLTVFAAYFLPRRHFLGLLVTVLIGYTLAIALNRQLPNLVQAAVVIAVIAGVSVTVSIMAERLRQAALHDPLTGALNRRGLDLHFAGFTSACDRRDAIVTVGMVDLDGFKAYNDAYGHAAGDAMLAAVAHEWRSAMHHGDLFARYGGDEFVVLLAGCDLTTARALATRVSSRLEIPCSCGFTERAFGEGLDQVLSRADIEMYRMKRRETT